MQRAVLIASLSALIAVLGGAAVGLAVAAGASPALSIAISEDDVFVGPISYTLTCSPAGGSLPRSARACAVIGRHPSMLLQAPAGLLEPCAYGLDVTFTITGGDAAGRVSATFQTCASGQSAGAGLWAGIVPSQAARLTVHVDRGFGELVLDESEGSVRRELGSGRTARPHCRTCSVSYSSAMPLSATFPVSLIIGYRGGRVASITSNDPDATVGGEKISDSYRALRRRLATWHAIACPDGVRLLSHGDGPATELTFLRPYTTVTVQDAPPNCP